MLRAIASTLAKHRAVVALMVISTALTCAVASNTASVIAAKWRVLAQRSGLDEGRIVVIQATSLDVDVNHAARQQETLARLQAVGGVDATATLGVMTFMNDLVLPLSVDDKSTGASLYFGSSRSLDALGVRLVSGSGFDEADFVTFAGGGGLRRVRSILLSRDLARRLFGDVSPVGRVVRLGDDRTAIVKGVTHNVLRPHPSSADPHDNFLTAIVPIVPDGSSVTYVLRANESTRAGALVDQARRIVQQSGRTVIVETTETLPALRSSFFSHQATVLRVLIFGTVSLLFVTLLGMGALANHWVRQRVRSIGIRRAIGATRGDILRYFLVENALVMGIGVVIGVVLAFALGRVLSATYDIPALASSSVAIAATVMWMLGWIATLKPAWWASRIPASVAMVE